MTGVHQARARFDAGSVALDYSAAPTTIEGISEFLDAYSEDGWPGMPLSWDSIAAALTELPPSFGDPYGCFGVAERTYLLVGRVLHWWGHACADALSAWTKYTAQDRVLFLDAGGEVGLRAQWEQFETHSTDERMYWELETLLTMACNAWRLGYSIKQNSVSRPDEVVGDWSEPIDLFGTATASKPATLTPDMLPFAIRGYAVDQSERMGLELAAIAIPALTVAAAAITDDLQIQHLRHDHTWLESARLWSVMIAEPGSTKTPAMKSTIKPLEELQATWSKSFANEWARYRADKDKGGDPIKPVERARNRQRVYNRSVGARAQRELSWPSRFLRRVVGTRGIV
ncbi:DUF3987 domain-containing protein [Hyphomicrobium sp. D-2]|uniref:DUF3987 domain-containing protein n=1 Tax=Hyphomicrobium sp. D-2 TaxID=3041621 RepID=UPI0024565DDB|nr:DUF3987 domain-containing protein [Hyphomicrobium sp. D-2]MDH4981456.1 DUF3987 domain-containing protein [Hyphomicrobium sp. D-2]